MTEPKITKINYSYQRQEPKVWVLNTDDLPIEKKRIKDQQIVLFDPGSYAGNHSHPRTEWFVTMDDLSLFWVDVEDRTHEVTMQSKDTVLLFEIPSNLPHAIRNNSTSKHGVLFEYADEKMSNAKVVEVI
ncbi:MAG: cupin domain-containing protein [Candidatus Pacebacteria bacterium]|nr:cupin domain-containing protein [Candidatus Paceibacterota bacterium]PIR63171.1 MAG: hypothetical protein COU64_05645 [Candidatus Pacebacteria bacterium CG10_big_fil_rev_8_21_14_0_10_40_26]PIZ78201.1 MAG: hypothetical protein COY01_05465 [Candidatus Pacebacteria bacterium CG_4_10_14_0_2_um_filter_40_20]PJA68754.1 MAG: hypothetical protein CO156_04580 [Candidatus Pacebacteria bacterium CG_4_9_14_3_um_filter_40_12]PJC41694.1 MAG: hypothetical protein CO041_03170 [Candidatus Pacebacteria bacter